MFISCKTCLPHPPFPPRESWYKQIWVHTIWGWFHTTFSFSGQIIFREGYLKDFYLFIPKLNPPPQFWSHPTTQDYNFNRLKFTLPENIFSQVSTFLVKWFWRRFKRLLFYLFHVKIQLPAHYCLVLQRTPQNHNLSIIWSKLPEEAFEMSFRFFC